MIIPGQKFEIKWHPLVKKYYLDLGYPNLKMHDTFTVPLDDLKPTSTQKVRCICDECNKEFLYEYVKIIKYGAELCPQCRMTNTFKQHYGKLENPKGNKQLSERKNLTHFQRTGYKSVSADPNIQQKRSDTYRNKTGYDNPFSNPKVIEIIQNKNLIAYKKHDLIPTSKYQKHLCSLLNGELNHIVGRVAIDIAFPNELIGIEYNGAAHFYGVLIKKQTLKDAKMHDIRRMFYLKKQGWKLIIIDHFSKKSPYSDDIVTTLINFCKNYLLNTKHKWIRIDFDNNVVYGKHLKIELNEDGSWKGEHFDYTKTINSD